MVVNVTSGSVSDLRWSHGVSAKVRAVDASKRDRTVGNFEGFMMLLQRGLGPAEWVGAGAEQAD